MLCGVSALTGIYPEKSSHSFVEKVVGHNSPEPDVTNRDNRVHIGDIESRLSRRHVLRRFITASSKHTQARSRGLTARQTGPRAGVGRTKIAGNIAGPLSVRLTEMARLSRSLTLASAKRDELLVIQAIDLVDGCDLGYAGRARPRRRGSPWLDEI